MNTISIVGSASRRAGGLFESVRHLHRELLRQNPAAEEPSQTALESKNREEDPDKPRLSIGVKVLTLQDEFTDADRGVWDPVPVVSFPIRGPRAFGYAPALSHMLSSSDPALVHVHGLWQFSSIAGVAWRQRTKGPLLISPHGMLDDWALRNSRLSKRIAWHVYERRHLRAATCIRALCQSEANSIRALGLANPVCVIPNGVDVPADNGHEEESQIAQKGKLLGACQKYRVLLYLGRLHPKKGLPSLLKAWAKLPATGEWLLAIAGWDQNGHEKELKSLAGELGIHWANSQYAVNKETSLLFPGPQFGAKKNEWLQACDAFILPSLSEGIPMAVLEAWAYAKPVLMTPYCNLPEGFSAQAAIPILPEPGSITNGLHELFRFNTESLNAIGSRGLALVCSRFAWPRIAADLRAVYFWMTGVAPRPKCVLTD